MCYSDPRKYLEIARSRMTAEQWEKFEREFNDFCVVQGLPDKWAYWPTYDWAKWAFFQGRQHSEKQMATVDVEKLVAEHFQALDIDPEDVYQHERNDVRNHYFEKIAIAMMDDEQAEASLNRLINYEVEMREKIMCESCNGEGLIGSHACPDCNALARR